MSNTPVPTPADSLPPEATTPPPVTAETLGSMKEQLDTRATVITARIDQLTKERDDVNHNLQVARAKAATEADRKRKAINTEVAQLREELATIDRVRTGFTRRTRTTKQDKQ